MNEGVTVVGVLVLTGCSGGTANQYPKKSIEMIVPFAPGGAVDTTIRILSGEAEKTLGQKIVVVNKAGGGAVEGQSYVARAKPDGYTLLAMTSSVVTNTLTKQVDFKVDSFEPIILYCFDPEVMPVYSGSPFQTLEQLIEHGKKEPILHATSGHSTSHHIAALLLEQKTGMKFKYVHTQGGTEQAPMIAGGHAVCGLSAWGEFRSMVDQGKVRILGVMSEKRDPRFPDIPTFKEKGIDLVYGAWRGIAAPKGTSPEIIERLHQAFKKALESKDVQAKFGQSGFPLMYQGPKEFGKVHTTGFREQ
ncbi:MAG TPA: tripartite tricarboxylate transporter substrate binding protein [Firmicutes bacterium]|nr:tripartite tricarboxylate transporter substrate binding protein [Bacillota bacterium]